MYVGRRTSAKRCEVLLRSGNGRGATTHIECERCSLTVGIDQIPLPRGETVPADNAHSVELHNECVERWAFPHAVDRKGYVIADSGACNDGEKRPLVADFDVRQLRRCSYDRA